MKSLRNKLKAAVLASLPAAAMATGCASTSSPLPQACAATDQGEWRTVDGGCDACDPLSEVCDTDGVTQCERMCSDCGCSSVERAVLDGGIGLAGTGVLPASVCANDCGAPPTPDAQLASCHLEYDRFNQPLTTADGAWRLSCAWDVAGATCAADAKPCLACDPKYDFCFVASGTCAPALGSGHPGLCGPIISEVEVPLDTPMQDGGAVDLSDCESLCKPPEGSPSDAKVDACHVELGPSGEPRQCEDNEIVACAYPHVGMCTGRRPEGFVPEGQFAELGGYFGSLAQLEAASIPAFRRLERELAAFDAPHPLRSRARIAAHDEVRHARVMSRLAKRFGGAVPKVQRPAFEPRSMLELAMENAVEGCVRETFGAALAMWQAERASEPEVRGAMFSIADDEARHAELAWDVAAWLSSRCRPEEREAIRAARAALAELEAGLDASPPSYAEAVGLPDSDEVRRLFDALAAKVWARA